MLLTVTKTKDVRAISSQLFIIKFNAKIEGYTELFPIIDYLIEFDRQVYEDYHIMKYDEKLNDYESVEDFDYYLDEYLRDYNTEVEIGEFIFKALNNIHNNDLLSLSSNLLDFLSGFHRGIYMYMLGRGYIDILDDKRIIR